MSLRQELLDFNQIYKELVEECKRIKSELEEQGVKPSDSRRLNKLEGKKITEDEVSVVKELGEEYDVLTRDLSKRFEKYRKRAEELEDKIKELLPELKEFDVEKATLGPENLLLHGGTRKVNVRFKKRVKIFDAKNPFKETPSFSVLKNKIRSLLLEL